MTENIAVQYMEIYAKRETSPDYLKPTYEDELARLQETLLLHGMDYDFIVTLRTMAMEVETIKQEINPDG